MVPADRFRLSIVLRRLCPSGFRWSAALWRFPAVNRFAAVSACSIPPPGFRLSTVLRRFLHRIFGCRSPLQRLCPSGFRWSAALWRFPAVNRFAVVSACSIPPPGFRLSTVLRWFLRRILVVDRLCSDFRRPILAAWLPGPAVSLLPDPCGPCGSGALAAAACGSRFSGRRAPEFRP